MRLFMQSKERFVFSLRAEDVFEAVRKSGVEETLEDVQIESALAQLCEWGNLQKHADTIEVGTVEDFFKQRHVFQITSQGEAAERASTLLYTTSDAEGELQSTALTDIRHVIEELRELSVEAPLDAGKIHRNLLMLRTRFEDLSATAQAFIGRLERKIYLQATDARQLIEFAERFIGELVLAADNIAAAVRDIDAAGFERLLQSVAERSTRDGMQTTPEDIAAVCGQWRAHWESFCNWFISKPGHPSNAECVRERARASIPALLSVTTRIHDRRMHCIDRSNDFSVLARWFAEADSDADAHRLWRASFGLVSARHLIINDATLDDHEAQDVSANTSWLEAPPLRIPSRLRDYSNNSRTGMLSRIIDRTEEKEKLKAATREEALRILNAQKRFETGTRMRLSELDHLETAEFELFLDLLGEAVSARVFSTEAVEILSGDGCLRVKLEPTGDGREASISTSEGMFSGPDYWISIEQIPTEVPI
jgi:uncharacterized protein (TIGR02677 family)